jgi:hypothetical protein
MNLQAILISFGIVGMILLIATLAALYPAEMFWFIVGFYNRVINTNAMKKTILAFLLTILLGLIVLGIFGLAVMFPAAVLYIISALMFIVVVTFIRTLKRKGYKNVSVLPGQVVIGKQLYYFNDDAVVKRIIDETSKAPFYRKSVIGKKLVLKPCSKK